MMQICLINPPIEDFYYTKVRRQPLGLLYIAGTLRHAGYTVSLIDGHSNKKHVMNLPGTFDYLQEYFNHSDPLLRFPFYNYYHFGLSYQEIRRQIIQSKASLFMISSMFTTYHEECENIINTIKEIHPFSFIAVGGYHASLYPDHFLINTAADFVIEGEGEEPALKLANAIFNNKTYDNIEGLSYKENGVISRTNRKNNLADIDSITSPARELLNLRQFKFYKKNVTPLIASRGCPNNCKFCSGKIIWGNSHRYRNTDGIVKEIDECVKTQNINCFNFEDENLFITKDRAVTLLEALLEYQKKNSIQLEFTAMNGISIENLDENIISLMKKTGFNEINISLVTHSEKLQLMEKRPFGTEHFFRIISYAKKLCMDVRAYFILGLPGQTKEEVIETIKYLNSLEIDFYPSVYYNVWAPYSQWKQQRSSAFFNESELLSRADLIRFFNICRKKSS